MTIRTFFRKTNKAENNEGQVKDINNNISIDEEITNPTIAPIKYQKHKEKLSPSLLDRIDGSINCAYSIGNKKAFEKSKKKLSKKLENSNWEILCTSADDIDTNQYGYKSVTLVNHKSKEILISTAGTLLEETWDIIDDALIYLQKLPYKIAPVKKMVSKIEELLPDQGKEYSFSCSGHSLGAIVAQLTLTEIIGKGLKPSLSTIWESPGGKPIIDNAAKQLFPEKEAMILETVKNHTIVYNAVPNFINTLHPQLADKCNELVVIKTNNNGLTKVIDSTTSWIEKGVNKVWSFIKNSMGYKWANKFFEGVKDHSFDALIQAKKMLDALDTEDLWISDDIYITDNYEAINNLNAIEKGVLAFKEEITPESYLKISTTYHPGANLEDFTSSTEEVGTLGDIV